MMSSRWPLWLQLTSAMVAASIAVALVAGQVMRVIETDYLRDELRRESLRMSQALTLTLLEPVVSGNEPRLRALLGRTSREDARVHSLALIDDAGRSVSRWVVDVEVDPQDVFYFSIPTDIPGRGQGQLVVSWNVGALTLEIQQHVDRLRVNVFLTVGLLSGLLVLLVHMLVMRPVDKLRRGLDALSRGETGERVRLSRFAASELDRLALSLGDLGRYQRELRATQESLERARHDAEAASEAKGRFLAVMSHEIRTPINGIVGSLELLGDGELNATRRSLLANAQRSADSLLEIINEILDFSRVESGRLELEAVEFQLEAQLNDVANSVAGLVDASQVELVVSFDPTLPARICGDPLRLRQVLTNLLGNAAKFTRRGAIVLRARRVDATHLCLEVEDTGMGIPVERQSNLFDPFTQADSSTTREYGGTGLGLSIVKQLVQLMGGSISLRSEPGVGSTFQILLPLDVREEARVLSAPVLANQAVLLVERNSHAAAALLAYLESFGMWPLHARDAEEAFSQLAELDIDGIRYLLVDARLACESGEAGFLYALRAAAGRDDTHLVMMIAPGTRTPEDAAFDVTLLKPVKRDELLSALADRNQTPDAPQAPDPMQAQTEAALGRVLVVDDNPMNLQVAVAMLERLGLATETAAGGVEALEKLDGVGFDVVLMDEQMPGMDGLEATRRLRAKDGPSAHTPVVALTANAGKDAEQRCLDAGMDAFVPKPVRRRALRMVLSRWIENLPAVGESQGAEPSKDGR